MLYRDYLTADLLERKTVVRNKKKYCDLVLAFWDGSSGGTGNCVRYAGKVGKPIENLWFEV